MKDDSFLKGVEVLSLIFEIKYSLFGYDLVESKKYFS